MLKKFLEGVFSFFQNLIFVRIGYKMHADLLKNFTDKLFIFIEKISCKFDFLTSYYLKIYNDLLEHEINLSNIKRNDSILVIGSGSLPVTPVHLAIKTGTNIEAIDFDKKSIVEADRIVKKMKLEDKIKIYHSFGQTYSLEKFDVIFIAYGLRSEKEVLTNISKNMKKTARIIFRTTYIKNQKEISDKEYLTELFTIKDIIRTKSFGQTDSLLLIKKQN